ncbi:MAG: hypothetical protein AAF616_03120 [Bacteroidota bacterium]
MRNLFYIILFFSFLVSCDLAEESISADPSLSLILSSDTVLFDTLISDSRSSTRRLKVINPNREAIRFGSIALAKGSDSDFSVVINGRSETRITDQVLSGGDSILILVEVNVTPRDQDLPYLVKDSVVFNWNGNSADVKLVAYGQDAAKRQNEIICDETWIPDRPYLIEGVAIVEENCRLTIAPGTRIFFENDAILLVQGDLIADGDSSSQIIFTSSRFDSGFDQVPGQWQGIIFGESSNSSIAYTTINNAVIGVGAGYQLVETDDSFQLLPGSTTDMLQTEIQITNSIINTCSLAGILAFNSRISSVNTLIYDCGQFLFGGFAGGDYSLVHNTLSNHPTPFVIEDPSIQFADNAILGDELLIGDLDLNIQNCILWSSADEELLISNEAEANLALDIAGNIIKSPQEIADNFTSSEIDFPGFSDPFLFDYTLDTLSFAKDKGLGLGILDDLLGKPRDAFPDIGAYERIEQ